MMERRLYRSQQDKRVFGICGGIAQFLNVDSTLVRVGVVILTVFTGIPILIYLLLALIMPKQPSWSYALDGFPGHEHRCQSYPRMNDLDTEIERLEKQALVHEVQRLRAELGKYKNM